MKTGGQHRGKNQLRIIGGKWRGRKLEFLDSTGLRPTGDRIRETLFNWIRPDLHGAAVLDLFAGSGALGFEAVSQGAANAVLIERDRACAEVLRKHCLTLDAESDITVVQSDAIRWMTSASAQQFDIVFVDPPFDDQLHTLVLDTLNTCGRLKTGALIYVESQKDSAFSVPNHWQLVRTKQAGNVRYALYQSEPNATAVK